MSITIPHPPLIGGVSQQAEGVRLENQVKRQDNAWSSVVDGLAKRPPTEHVKNVWNSTAQCHVHWINRDENERYAVLIFNQGIRIYDLAGTQYSIYKPDDSGLQLDFSYLDYTGTGVAARAVTISDTTFILNPFAEVEINTAFQNENWLEDTERRAYLFVKAGQYDQRYTVTVGLTPSVGGAEVTSTIWAETFEGDSGSAWGNDEIGSIRTNNIATELYDGSAAKVPYTNHTGLNGVTNLTATQSGSVVKVEAAAGYDITTWEVTDGAGDTLISGWKREIERITDLPTYGFNGNVVKIVGGSDDTADDYFVKHVRGGDGPGKWVETVDPSVEQAIDLTTMPHWLVRKQDDGVGTVTGTPNQIYFSFGWEPVTGGLNQSWAYRLVGDDETNPFPSFVTEDIADVNTHRQIDDIFFWQNRLGLLSGSNVIFSEAGVYENFFRTTVREALDSDPIDFAVGHEQVHTLHSAVPADDELFVFSPTTQFVVKSDAILSNRTVRVEPKLNYDNLSVKPAASGRGAFFPYRAGEYSGVRELIRINEETFDAPNVSIQVPRYIEGDITELKASEVLNCMACSSDGDDDALFVYRYFWNGDEKVQSAWFRFLLGNTARIKGFEFFDNDLYIVVQRGDFSEENFYLEKIDLEERNADPSSTWVVTLDRRITDAGLTRNYTAGSNSTEITLPYDLATGEVPWVTTRPAGAVLPVLSTDTATPGAHKVTVQGDHSSDDLWLGSEYLMDVELPQAVLRATNRRGYASILNSPVQVLRGHIAYRDSAAFTVRSAGDQSTDNDETFSSFIVGQTPVGTVNLDTGVFTFSVWSKGEDATVSLRNATPHPSNFNELEWEIKSSSTTSRWRG